MTGAADVERASVDRDVTGAGVNASKRKRAGTALGERAGSTQNATKRLVGAAAIYETTCVADVSQVGTRAELASAAYGEYASVDGGGTRVIVIISKREGSRAVFG